MAHQQQFDFIQSLKTKFPQYFTSAKVLEVGSLNINGSIRQFFSNCDYLGIDVGPGVDVDLVSEGQKLQHPNDSYDTVGSCECFEHNPYWVETFNNMYRMTKSNGLLFMSCATTGRAEHGTTRTSPQDSPLTVTNGWEYYKNLTELDFRKYIDIDNMFVDYQFSEDNTHFDLYFYGIKKEIA